MIKNSCNKTQSVFLFIKKIGKILLDLVCSKMSPLVHRFLISYYNFSAIFCFKLRDEKYQISNFIVLCNVIKLPLVLIFSVYVIDKPLLRDEIFLETLIVLKDFSPFSRFSISVVVILIDLSMFILIQLQVLQRHKIKNFTNTLISNSLDEKYFAEFKKKTTSHLLVLTSVSVLSLLFSYFGAFNVSILSFFASLIYFFPHCVMVGFISFVLLFTNFVLASLEEFKNDLRMVFMKENPDQDFSFQNYLRLSRKYQKLYELVEQFNGCFGSQLTLITCYLSAMMVFNVRIT